jgi:hypothetical protein
MFKLNLKTYNQSRDYYLGAKFRYSRHIPLTWTEVKEAVSYTKNMDGKIKSDYMYSVGIDYNKCVSTFSTIWLNEECDKIDIY